MSTLRAGGQWLGVAAAAVASTIALDVTATATGTALALSPALDDSSPVALYGVLVATYALWGVALRSNVVANSNLLEHTGVSTNLVSKLLYELLRYRSSERRR